MAEENEDPREVPWHPRFAKDVVGHDAAKAHFIKAFSSGKPHHAWLLHGPKGIGKATLAYNVAVKVLGDTQQTRHWVESRAHPDLFVLERQLNDSKPRKLKAEIAVDDTRKLSDFFSRTASGEWRVAIIDAADDLSIESANAILKLVEEPPAKALILLVSHQPGTLLRTLKSRCLRVPLAALADVQTDNIINDLALEEKVQTEELSRAITQSKGSPGWALTLLHSVGAKAFAIFAEAGRLTPGNIASISAKLGGRGVAGDEFGTFTALLLNWVSERAKLQASRSLAEAHATISTNARIAEGFNLDRRQAVAAQLTLINDALKAS